MKTIRIGDRGKPVIVLQRLLQKLGYSIVSDGDFGPVTDRFVRQMQSQYNLIRDGIVGNNTWRTLMKYGYNFTLGAENYSLDSQEFFHGIYQKKTIFLHHTAGKYRPDYTIDWWASDGGVRRVGTAFVIGRRDPKGKEDYDGRVLRAFKETKWAHHLGIRNVSNNTILNKQSIGIELCSLGALDMNSEGQYYWRGDPTYIIPNRDVCVLEQPWRNERFFHKYTKAQIRSCKELILTLAYIFQIELPDRVYDQSWFEIDRNALAGVEGIWTHANVRTDKWDCFPQPELIDMLNSLHSEFKEFFPKKSAWDSMKQGSSANAKHSSKIQNYAVDLDNAQPEEMVGLRPIDGFQIKVQPLSSSISLDLFAEDNSYNYPLPDLPAARSLALLLQKHECFLDDKTTIRIVRN